MYAACDPQNVNKVTNAIIQNMARLQGTEADIQADWFIALQGHDHDGRSAGDGDAGGAGEIRRRRMSCLGWAMIITQGFGGADQCGDVAGGAGIWRGTRLSRCVVTICTPAPETCRDSGRGVCL